MQNFAAGFKAFQTTVGGATATALNSAQGALANVEVPNTKAFKSSFQNFQQGLKERAGNADDITELPQEYLDLERRVDGLKIAHVGFLKVAKAYGSESYDYPVQIQESAQEIGTAVSHQISSWAAAATKGTNFPQPPVTEKGPEVHKTLPHALSRAAATAAVETGPSRLSNVLKTYSVTQDQIGAARVAQDEDINKNFLQPWSATLNSSLQAAIRSRQNVKTARVSLDACRGVLKASTGGPKQEQARLEVEAAEEKLVLATEEAINLMRAVLENPEPIKNLASLIKAQQEYYAKAAESLATIQAEVEEASVLAEAEYRKSRAQLALPPHPEATDGGSERTLVVHLSTVRSAQTMAPFAVGSEEDQEMSIEFLQAAAVRSKESRLTEIAQTRQQQLKHLFYAVKDKQQPARFEAGFPPTPREGDMDVDGDGDDEAQLDEFVRKHDGADALASLDVTIPELSPSPPPSPPQKDAATASANAKPQEPAPSPVLSSAGAAASATASAAKEVSSTKPDATLPPTPLVSVTPSSNDPTRHPSASPKPSPAPASTIPTASTSALPYASSSSATLNPAAISTAPSPTPVASSSSAPIFSLAATDPDYAKHLPELPLDVYRNRLNNSVRKKGKEKAGSSLGPDLYRMNVKAQHTGAKNFLGRGKRVHNVMSTHDWSIGLEEVRALRAFEKIEKMKEEKAWSFRQPKKQRVGAVPKSHWDHLMDEMKWMQTDFRQERRWKVVTAYQMALSVRDWHRATPEERVELCVRTRPPNFLPVSTEEEVESSASSAPMSAGPSGSKRPSRESTSMDVDADGEDDAEGEADADGEADDASATLGGSAQPATPAVKPEATPTTPGTARLPPNASDAQRSHANALHIQHLINLRAPVFELGPGATLVDNNTLPSSDDPASQPLVNLFPDLPLYSDFLTGIDPALDRRFDEASGWAGRLNHISHWLDAKPLLVSTIQPGRTKTKDGWDASAPAFLDDTREGQHELRDVPPTSSSLFAGRRSKEKKDKEDGFVDPVSRPVAPPTAALRATSLLWTPEDDALVLELQKTYGSHWNLMAELFNAQTHRPPPDHRLPWDIYDRWDRLVGPGSKRTLPDGVQVPVPLPQYKPPEEKGGGPSLQFVNFDGPKKSLRHATIYDAMRKVQKKRDFDAGKRQTGGIPKRVNLSMHDSHILPPRPFFTPIEWSQVRVEQDTNKRMRAAQEAALQQQRLLAQQQAHQNGVRYSQPPQGFPIQQGRAPLQPQPGRPVGMSPNGMPNNLPNSSPHALPSPIPGGQPSPSPTTGVPQMNAAFAAQFANGIAQNGGQLTPGGLTPDQVQAYQTHQRQLMYQQAQLRNQAQQQQQGQQQQQQQQQVQEDGSG
ncbi:chromatin modification-related protein [Pseudohyphozyma bogoriensis]|nr:chromatin modification-related protein [Pseudohyphozyma bogoriensis]